MINIETIILINNLQLLAAQSHIGFLSLAEVDPSDESIQDYIIYDPDNNNRVIAERDFSDGKKEVVSYLDDYFGSAETTIAVAFDAEGKPGVACELYDDNGQSCYIWVQYGAWMCVPESMLEESF